MSPFNIIGINVPEYPFGDRGKNSPTAVHVGRKRRVKWVPVAVGGGIAGPPYPGVYKYGGLALQIGGWATIRQPVTVRNLTGRKPNCGLGVVRQSKKDVDSGKG
jgi:hypothetical protein